jgi:hypothetical protein
MTKPPVRISLICLLLLFFLPHRIPADTLHELYTTDGIKYKGKFVAFKYGTFYFNVYKFGKVTRKLRIPLSKVWKLIINPHNQNQIISSFELNEKYRNLRRGKKSRSFTLAADRQWLNTGISLSRDQRILFSISGIITIARNLEVNQGGQKTTRWHREKPMPTMPTGAVIARIGEEGQPFYVGESLAPFRVENDGVLFIGINDHLLTDNVGNFTVTVYY